MQCHTDILNSDGVLSFTLEGSNNSLESPNIFVLGTDEVSTCRNCMRINKGSISNLGNRKDTFHSLQIARGKFFP